MVPARPYCLTDGPFQLLRGVRRCGDVGPTDSSGLSESDTRPGSLTPLCRAAAAAATVGDERAPCTEVSGAVKPMTVGFAVEAVEPRCVSEAAACLMEVVRPAAVEWVVVGMVWCGSDWGAPWAFPSKLHEQSRRVQMLGLTQV